MLGANLGLLLYGEVSVMDSDRHFPGIGLEIEDLTRVVISFETSLRFCLTYGIADVQMPDRTPVC